MWIELAKAIVEFVKAAAWPMAFVIVALSFKPGLLAALPSLSRRKIEVEGLGFKAKIDATEQQQAATANPATENLPKTPALDPSPRSAVNIIETKLNQELKGFEAEKHEAILVRALAHSRLEAGHEFAYNRIFGSQIVGLKRLNEIGRAKVDDARQFFNPYAEKFPEIYREYSFDSWLGFLKSCGLVTQEGSFLEISEFGRDFLMYLTERRLTENKAW